MAARPVNPNSFDIAREVNRAIAESAATIKSGSSVQDGDASKVAFTIAHGLGSTPSAVIVSPRNAVSDAARTITAGSANITVTYASAPAAGTGNIVLDWLVTK